MAIQIMRSEIYTTPILIGSHSAICPICGVSSNLHPCYDEGEGTGVLHRLTYCHHQLEGNRFVLALPSIPMEIT